MSQKKKPMRLLSLPLAILTLLTGCSQPAPCDKNVVAVCASQNVKDYLHAVKPPPYVIDYFKLIGDEQASIRNNKPCP